MRKRMSSFLLLYVPLSCISTPFSDNKDVEIVQDTEIAVFSFFFFLSAAEGGRSV